MTDEARPGPTCPPWCVGGHSWCVGGRSGTLSSHFGPVRRGRGQAEVRAALHPDWDAPRILIFDHGVDDAPGPFLEIEAAAELAGALSREAPALAAAIRKAVADAAAPTAGGGC